MTISCIRTLGLRGRQLRGESSRLASCLASLGVTTRIRVAVCTNRAPEAVREALAAIAADAPEAARALVTSGLAPAAVDAHRTAAPGWEVLAEPEPGLSRARNRALAWAAGDDEVLAFVDDDAVVEPGWHDA